MITETYSISSYVVFHRLRAVLVSAAPTGEELS